MTVFWGVNYCFKRNDVYEDILYLSRTVWQRRSKIQRIVLTSGGFIFNGLLEDSDILERAEEQDHFIVLVPDGGHLHVEPHRGS